MMMQFVFKGLSMEVVMDDEMRRLVDEDLGDKMLESAQKSCAEAIKSEIDENFSSGGRPTWEPKADGSPATLVDTGALRQAATVDAIVDFTEDEVTISTNASVDYAGKVNDKRPFMVIPEGQPMDNVAKAYLDGMTDALEGKEK